MPSVHTSPIELHTHSVQNNRQTWLRPMRASQCRYNIGVRRNPRYRTSSLHSSPDWSRSRHRRMDFNSPSAIHSSRTQACGTFLCGVVKDGTVRHGGAGTVTQLLQQGSKAKRPSKRRPLHFAAIVPNRLIFFTVLLCFVAVQARSSPSEQHIIFASAGASISVCCSFIASIIGAINPL